MINWHFSNHATRIISCTITPGCFREYHAAIDECRQVRRGFTLRSTQYMKDLQLSQQLSSRLNQALEHPLRVLLGHLVAGLFFGPLRKRSLDTFVNLLRAMFAQLI